MDYGNFKAVPNNEISKLLCVLGQSWPRHFLFHQYISLLIMNKNRTSQINQTLYLAGDFYSGAYLVGTEFFINPTKLTLFFVYTVSSDLTLLRRALAQTSVIPWSSHRYAFEVTLPQYTPVVRKVFVEKGLKAVLQHYRLFWLPEEDVVDCTHPPENVYIDRLNRSEAQEVADNWPHFPGCEQFVAEQVTLSVGLGVFRKSDKKMLSSILSFHSGGVFMLYSRPEARRKGYGEIILRRLVTELRHKGIIPFCTVFSDNIPSLNLIKKVGFVELHGADYIFHSLTLDGP